MIIYQDIQDYVKCSVLTFNDIELFEAFPRKEYSNKNMTIEEAKLSKNQILIAKIL